MGFDIIEDFPFMLSFRSMPNLFSKPARDIERFAFVSAAGLALFD
jgi:hypothetical protein